MSTVQVIEEDDHYTALDEETGTKARGETKGSALLSLVVALQGIDNVAESLSPLIAFHESVEQLQATNRVLEQVIATSELSHSISGDVEEKDTLAAYDELSSDVQTRFENDDVSEDEVEEAIAWARRR